VTLQVQVPPPNRSQLLVQHSLDEEHPLPVAVRHCPLQAV
jgi:hypothetical protein